jgi:hypothetical protein
VASAQSSGEEMRSGGDFDVEDAVATKSIDQSITMDYTKTEWRYNHARHKNCHLN